MMKRAMLTTVTQKKSSLLLNRKDINMPTLVEELKKVEEDKQKSLKKPSKNSSCNQMSTTHLEKQP